MIILHHGRKGLSSLANLKPKPCKDCKKEFHPFKPMQPRCVPCAMKKGQKDTQRQREKAQEASRKAFNKETRKRKDKLKTRSEWIKDAQRAFNRFIRLRDYGHNCISCGRNTGAKVNAGHYLTVGGHPELRFSELNCHLQCEHCNSYLSGNIARYRPSLIAKIGIDGVDWLEGPHEAKKYTIDDLKEIKQKYAKLARELEKEINN